MNSKTRVKGLVRFFTARGRSGIDRKKTLDDFTPQEIVDLIRLLRGRDVHDLMAYINTCHSAAPEVTVDDVIEAKNLLDVKDVLDA